MYGGTIIGNYATNGGAGVRVNNGVFNMLDGRICYNASSSAAGVRVKNSRAKMTMHGGTIDNNNAFSNEAGKGGGGIEIDDDDAEVVLIGGEIKENTASGDGGGIYIAGNATKGLTISGSPVVISGNTAAGKGGGIYFAGKATASLTISGSPVISGNTADGSPNNVYLTNGKTIKIGGNFFEGVRIPVTTEAKPQTGSPVTITGALGDYAVAANFTSDDSRYVVAGNGTEAVLAGSSDAVKFSYTFEFVPEPSEEPEVTGTPEAGYYLTGVTIPAGTPGAEGYEFDGWTDDGTGDPVTGGVTMPEASTGSVSITGTFTKLYDVNWYSDEGELIATTPVRHNEAPNSPGNEDVPSKDASGDICCYDFIGWNSDPDAATALGEPLDAVTADTDYYAVFEAVSHDWGDPSYEWTQEDGAWKCTASIVCANDEEHTETETVTAAGELTTPATCDAKGKTTYTATFLNQAFAEQTKEVEDVDAADHVWKFAGFTWIGSDTDGYTAAAANYVCENYSGHKQTADAEIKRETADAVCETGGTVVYTATVSANQSLDGEEHTATKTVETAAAGHKLTGTDAKGATCTEAGNSEYWTCSVCGAYFSDAEGKTAIEENSWVIEATGHDWGEATYEWAEDLNSCTAARVCANDAEHVETESVKTASEVTKKATATKAGERTYTAEFENEAFEPQTRTETIPAKGKDRPKPEPEPKVKPEIPFTDVTKDMDLYDDVKFVYEKGIMIGMSDTLFGPDTTLSRAMLVTVLYRMEGKPGAEYAGVFSDVPAGEWYSDAVEWAAAEGIVLGYGDGTFGVNDDVTREQLATIFWRYAKWKDYDVSVGEDTNILSFNDAFDTSDWAMAAMQWAIGSGALEGDAYGCLNGGEPATRAEIAKAIHVFLNTVAK